MVVQAFNPSTQKEETGGFLTLDQTGLQRILGQLGLLKLDMSQQPQTDKQTNKQANKKNKQMKDASSADMHLVFKAHICAYSHHVERHSAQPGGDDIHL